MEPPSFPPSGLFTVRAAPGSDATLVLPLPTGTPPFNYQWSRAGASLDERFTGSDDAGGVRLTVSNARTGDTDVYTLQASNAAGCDTSSVRLEVCADEAPTGEDPPTFLRRLQDLTVKVGTRTRFLVEIISSTECKVTWYRNERRLLEAERVALARDGNFWCADVAAVSVDDAGRWTCTAENAGGRASCSAHLNVLVPKAYKRPEFVEELRALLTEQGTVSLECKVVGVPTPVLRWFKDSREIKAGDVFALTANAEDPTSLGTYTCEAVNCMGRAYSSSKVHVVGRGSREGSARPSSSSVTPEPPPIFTKELEDQFVRICEPLTLGCHIVLPPWPRSVVWYNKEGKIEPSERYHVLEDGAGGYLLEVPCAEWPDEGEWKCVATSTGGRVGISTCYVTMDVPKNYRKPRFMENLQAVLTEEGLVSFECKVVGFPTPVLSWFKDGQELKPGDVYQLTGTNSLGSYCCIARNCMGQTSSSAELTVEDIQNQLNEEEKLQLFSKNQAPKFIQGLKSVEAKIDEPFRFTVKVAIPPEPSVLWYRDDQPVDESSRCHHGREDRGVFYLDIQSLEFLDQAEWKCVAMNDFGHSVTSCFLKLIIPRHYKKPRFLENLQAILSEEGAVNLECKVIGVPQPILKWYKDGEELKPGDIHRIISGQDGTCCLGTYTCEAQNCMGIAASSAALLGFDDSLKAKKKKAEEQALQRNLSLSTIHEERTSQMYDTPVGDITTLDDKGEISFSFDGKEVSVSLYETPDLTEEEALQIVEMYADQLSENITEHNVVELPPLRFVKETSTSGNLLMEAVIIDVSPEYFVSPDEDMRTEADIEDISIADENGPPQLSLDQDIDIGGEDYLEKTMALLSEEKSDIPFKYGRKKSDSQRSADDFFSLSRDQSLSEEKRDDDTQAISESDLQSFASAHSSEKPKSKSSKPSGEDGQESSEPTKTCLFKDDAIKHSLDAEPSPVVKPKRERRTSRSSRRSSSGSEKSVSKSREEILRKKESFELEMPQIPKLTDEEFKEKMAHISSTLSKVINDVQIIERDIILKSELMSSAATASRSLEIIGSLISPLSEIHSIADAAKESAFESKEVSSTLFNSLPQPLKALQQSLTIIEKCIDMESDNKTLVKKTCVAFIETCGSEMQELISDVNAITSKDYLLTEGRVLMEIESLNNEMSTVIKFSTDTIKTRNLLSEASEIKVDEPSLEVKHLRDTQKAVFELKSPLNSLLYIAENAESGKIVDVTKVKNSEVILNDMSGSIQDLQTALEQIEILSVKESTTSLHKYNTEIIETVMESVVKLRNSFEQLSTESGSDDKAVLKNAVASIKENLNKISSQIEVIEKNVGTFDVLHSENKLDALQKMAQILIALENNLPRLELMPVVKNHMTVFHKNLTKVLENVIESNESKKYFNLMEICDAVNRMNDSIKNLDVDNVLPLASLNNTLRIIHDRFIINVFDSELNCCILTNIADTLVVIQETINIAEEVSVHIDSEHIQDLPLHAYDDTKAKIAVEHINHVIAAIENVKAMESTQVLQLRITPTLENICPVLEELKRSVASIKSTEFKDEHISDISEVSSFAQTLATPLCELNQNIIVLNQQIVENIESMKENSEVMATIAEPLHELHSTLQILQQDVISQYGEDLTPYDVSINMASAVQNLQSCIVIIQEHAGVEAADEMSTLEDISGIKTTAETIPSDRLVLPAAEETAVQHAIALFDQELQSTATAQALQTLHEHITVLQTPEILDALDTLSEVSDYSSLKSFVVGLGELHSGIEEVLHPLLMEGSHEISNLINPSKLTAIAEPMQELQQSLSVLDTSNIPIYENILEMPSERIHSVIQSVSEFKEHLDKCMLAVFPVMQTADNTVEISNKVGALREMCEHLKYIIETTKAVEGIPVPEEVSALEFTVDNLLDATDVSKGIKIEQVKTITEELYKNVATVQEEMIQFTPQPLAKLAQEAKLIQTINEVQSNIAVLEQYDFVDLSRASDLTCTSPQVAIEIESNSLILMEDIVDSAVNIVQDFTQDMPIADLMIVEDFFKTCKNEFTILRCLISKATTHKKIIRLLQEFSSLQSTINDFKTKKFELNLSDDINGCLATFLIHADDCLQDVQTSLLKIVDSQSELLIKAPLAKFENSAKILKAVTETKPDELITETVNKLVGILETAKPTLRNVQADIVNEIKSTGSHVEDITLINMIEEFTIFVEEAKIQNEDIVTKRILEKVTNCIEKHQDYKDASGTGKTLILLKCLSDCTDILQESLFEVNIPKQKVEEGPLMVVLTEMLEPLQALHNQLTLVQEQVVRGVDEDSISVDISTTESLVQTMTEKHKEIIERIKTEQAVANEEMSLIMEVDKEIHSIQDSLRSMKGVQVAQVVKEISKPVEEIEKSLHAILSSEKISIYSEDKLPTEKAKQIIQHIDQYIELIEIVEEISAIIKIEDVKETMGIAKELRDSIAASENIAFEKVTEVRQEQTRLAQKLQMALSALQVQVLENAEELTPALSTEVVQRIAHVTAQLQADLVAVTGIQMALQAPAETVIEIAKSTDAIGGQIACSTVPELATVAIGSEPTILEEVGVVELLSSSEVSSAITEMLEHATAESKEVITSEGVNLLSTDDNCVTMESTCAQTEENIAIEGTEPVLIEQSEKISIDAIPKESALSEVVTDQAGEVSSKQTITTESVSAVAIEDLGPELFEVTADDKQAEVGISQTAELQELPKATIDIFVQHIDQLISEDITEVINELSTVMNVDELKQSISIAKELREIIAASEAGLKAETSDVLKDEISIQQAELVRQLFTAIAALENLPLDTLAEIPSIKKEDLQRMAEITENLRVDLSIVTAKQDVVDQVNETKQEQAALDTAQLIDLKFDTVETSLTDTQIDVKKSDEPSISEEKLKVSTEVKPVLEDVKYQENKDNVEGIAPSETIKLSLEPKDAVIVGIVVDEEAIETQEIEKMSVSPDAIPISLEEVTITDVLAATAKQVSHKTGEPLKTPTIETLLHNIDEFLSDNIVQTIDQISATLSVSELKQSVAVACELRERIAITDPAVTDIDLVADKLLNKQAHSAQQLLSALSTVQILTMDNTNELIRVIGKKALDEVTVTTTKLYVELAAIISKVHVQQDSEGLDKEKISISKLPVNTANEIAKQESQSLKLTENVSKNLENLGIENEAIKAGVDLLNPDQTITLKTSDTETVEDIPDSVEIGTLNQTVIEITDVENLFESQSAIGEVIPDLSLAENFNTSVTNPEEIIKPLEINVAVVQDEAVTVTADINLVLTEVSKNQLEQAVSATEVETTGQTITELKAIATTTPVQDALLLVQQKPIIFEKDLAVEGREEFSEDYEILNKNEIAIKVFSVEQLTESGLESVFITSGEENNSLEHVGSIPKEITEEVFIKKETIPVKELNPVVCTKDKLSAAIASTTILVPEEVETLLPQSQTTTVEKVSEDIHEISISEEAKIEPLVKEIVNTSIPGEISESSQTEESIIDGAQTTQSEKDSDIKNLDQNKIIVQKALKTAEINEGQTVNLPSITDNEKCAHLITSEKLLEPIKETDVFVDQLSLQKPIEVAVTEKLPAENYETKTIISDAEIIQKEQEQKLLSATNTELSDSENIAPISLKQQETKVAYVLIQEQLVTESIETLTPVEAEDNKILEQDGRVTAYSKAEKLVEGIVEMIGAMVEEAKLLEHENIVIATDIQFPEATMAVETQQDNILTDTAPVKITMESTAQMIAEATKPLEQENVSFIASTEISTAEDCQLTASVTEKEEEQIEKEISDSDLAPVENIPISPVIFKEVEARELDSVPETKRIEHTEIISDSCEASAAPNAPVVISETFMKLESEISSQQAESTKSTFEQGSFIQHIDEFISEDTSELVNEMLVLTNSQEVIESVNLAKVLKESIEFAAVAEESDLLEEMKMEQAKLAQKLQDALLMLHTKAMESAAEIRPDSKPDTIQKVTEIIMRLQEDLKTAIMSDMPEVHKAVEIVEVPETEENSMKQLEVLLQGVTDKINLPTDRDAEDTEVLRDALDEVQAVIIKLKRDYDGAANDTLNETLEDLECSVRSVQLQIGEDSPPELLKEACATLQLLVNNMSETQDIRIAETVAVKYKNEDILNKCSCETEETIKLLDLACKVNFKDEKLTNIISSLNIIKDTMKTLKSSFVGNADVLIEKGIDVVQSLDQLEDRVFMLEKDLAEASFDLETRDNILTAVHSVFGSISNMRGTISSIQKRYMFENYGQPSEIVLRSIKNVSELSNIEDTDKQNWKKFTKSLRKVLNHFEDIKFYINLDKTARLPSDAAFTKIILEELKSNIYEVMVPQASMLGPEVTGKISRLIYCVKKNLASIESKSTLGVKEKIPIFKEISSQMLTVTDFLKSKIIKLAKESKSTIVKQEPETLAPEVKANETRKTELLDTVTESKEIAQDILTTKIKLDEISKIDEVTAQIIEQTEVKKTIQESPSTSKVIQDEAIDSKSAVRKQVLIKETDVETQVEQIALDLVAEIAAEAIAVVQNLEDTSGFQTISVMPETLILQDTDISKIIEDTAIPVNEKTQGVEEAILMMTEDLKLIAAMDEEQGHKSLDETIQKTEELIADESHQLCEENAPKVEYVGKQKDALTKDSVLTKHEQKTSVASKADELISLHEDKNQENLIEEEQKGDQKQGLEEAKLAGEEQELKETEQTENTELTQSVKKEVEETQFESVPGCSVDPSKKGDKGKVEGQKRDKLFNDGEKEKQKEPEKCDEMEIKDAPSDSSMCKKVEEIAEIKIEKAEDDTKDQYNKTEDIDAQGKIQQLNKEEQQKEANVEQPYEEVSAKKLDTDTVETKKEQDILKKEEELYGQKEEAVLSEARIDKLEKDWQANEKQEREKEESDKLEIKETTEEDQLKSEKSNYESPENDKKVADEVKSNLKKEKQDETHSDKEQEERVEQEQKDIAISHEKKDTEKARKEKNLKKKQQDDEADSIKITKGKQNEEETEKESLDSQEEQETNRYVESIRKEEDGIESKKDEDVNEKKQEKQIDHLQKETYQQDTAEQESLKNIDDVEVKKKEEDLSRKEADKVVKAKEEAEFDPKKEQAKQKGDKHQEKSAKDAEQAKYESKTESKHEEESILNQGGQIEQVKTETQEPQEEVCKANETKDADKTNKIEDEPKKKKLSKKKEKDDKKQLIQKTEDLTEAEKETEVKQKQEKDKMEIYENVKKQQDDEEILKQQDNASIDKDTEVKQKLDNELQERDKKCELDKLDAEKNQNQEKVLEKEEETEVKNDGEEIDKHEQEKLGAETKCKEEELKQEVDANAKKDEEKTVKHEQEKLDADKKRKEEEKLKKEAEAKAKKDKEEAEKREQEKIYDEKKRQEELKLKEEAEAKAKKDKEEAVKREQEKVDAEMKRKEEEKLKTEAEAKAKKDKEEAEKREQEKMDTEKKRKEEEILKKEAEAKAKKDKEEAEKREQEKIDDEKKRKEELKLKEEAEAKAKEEAEKREQEKVDAEMKLKEEEKLKTEAEAKAKKDKEEAEKREQEKMDTEKKRKEEETLKKEAEAKAKKDKEEAEKREQEKSAAEKKRKEEEKLKTEAEAKAKKDKEEAEKREQEIIDAEKIRKEEENLKKEAEAKAKKDKDEAEKREQEKIAAEKKRNEEEKLKKEAEAKAKKDKEEAEKREQEKMDDEKKRKEEEKLKTEAEAKAKKDKEEAEKREQEKIDAEKKRTEEEKLKTEAEAKAKKDKEEAEKREQEKIDAEKKRTEEEKLKTEAEAKAKKDKEEAEKREQEKNEAEKKRNEEEKLKTEAEAKAKKDKEEAEKREQEKNDAEMKRNEEEKLKTEAEAKAKKDKEEAEKRKQEKTDDEKKRNEEEKLKTEAEAKAKKDKEEAEKREQEKIDDEKKRKEEEKLKTEAEAKAKKNKEEAEKREQEKNVSEKKRKKEENLKTEAEAKAKKDKEEAEKREQEKNDAEKKRNEEEKLKTEAEAKAKKDKEEAEKREQEKNVSEKKRKKEENLKTEAEAKAKKDKEEAEKREQEKIDDEKKRKEEEKLKTEAEAKAKKDKEEAEKREQEKIYDEKKRKEELKLKTEAEAKAKKDKEEADKREQEKMDTEKKRKEEEILKKEAEAKAKKDKEEAEKREQEKSAAEKKRKEEEKLKTEAEAKAKKNEEEAEKREQEKNVSEKKRKKEEKLKTEAEAKAKKDKEEAEKREHEKIDDEKKRKEEEKLKTEAEAKAKKNKEETENCGHEKMYTEKKLKEERLKEEEAKDKKEKKSIEKNKEEKLRQEKEVKSKKGKEAEIERKDDDTLKKANQKDTQKEEKQEQDEEIKSNKQKEENDKREKEKKRLEKGKQEEKQREDEEKAALEKKKATKKRREEEEARLQKEIEEADKVKKDANKKRKDEIKAQLLKQQEEAEAIETEKRETERRIREERRREIENDLIENKSKSCTEDNITGSKHKREENGDVSMKRRSGEEDHYIREYHYEPTKQKSDERSKFVDHNHRDYTMEFSRPSGYRERTFEHEKYSERESLGRSATIYKAQTIILDSQLRSSAPPQPERSECEKRVDRHERSDSEKRIERQRSKALSEARSMISEKRSSLSRDLKRKPVFSTYLTDRTAVEGSRVKLTCSVLSSSDPKITWYKNGVVLDDKLKYRTKFIDGLITLEVLNAVVSDSAEYSCTVENENGSVNTSANLKVYPSFEASPIPPTFTRSIRDTYHLAENELVLECRIRGQPLPTITWLKDDKPVSTNERYQAYYLADGVCRLAISSPTPDDSGKYTCKAENSVWSDQITHVVSYSGKESHLNQNIATIERSRFNRQVLESRRLHFTNVLSDYKVAKGGTIGLQVEIKGCPTRVEWLREGHSVTEIYRNARTFVEQGLYTLALSDVTEKESGMYTCRAWSTHGNVDMNAAITVVPPNELDGKPAIIVGRPEKDILISVGEDVNISFRVQGDPKPKVVFMKGIRDITTNQRVCKMTSDDYVKFTLKRSVVSDAGTYCILARNAYGCDRAFVTVVVRQRASSENLISDWTYPMDDSALSITERKFKSVPDRIPGEPSVVDGGNNWVSLAWPKADPRDTAPVLAYKIESWLIGKEGGARWVELGITPLNSFDAFNLKQGEEYHFRVTPRNRYGWGESVQTSAPLGIGLAGDRPEFVDILPGQLKVLAGATANLSCSVKGKPLPEVVWMKNGHEIEEESRIRTAYNGQDCSLTIKDICIEDEARYSCEASNVHGRASTYARLAVVTDRLIWEADAKLKRERSQDAEGDYPPQYTMRLRDRRVQATYPVRLTCQVVGNPPPTVTWFKDGELLVFDNRRNNYQDEHFHTLEIAPTTLEDGGVYEAMARNSSGAVSCRCSLVVDKGIRAYVAPEFCCGLEPLYRLSEGEELRISAVVEAYPSVGVTWYRDGVRLRPSRRAIMTLDRDGQIELALAAVTGRDAGVYTCTASNEVGRASTSGKVEVVEGDQPREKRTPPVMINAPDVPYSKEPMFVRKPRSSEAREGDTVIIACEVIGDPKPDVYWLRDFLKPDYYRDATHFKRVGDGPEYRFEIPHAKLDYTGAYSVVARNVHGEAKAIISLQILAKDPSSTDDTHNVRYGRVEVIPRFERELTDLLSYDGDAVEFECRVTGNPEPDIRWFHYNELIRECPDFESSFDDGAARLKIKQVTAEDEGTYSCEAANNLGKATSSACLVVYPPGEPNTLSQRLRRPPALLSAASTPRSTPRSTPARSVSRTPGPDTRRLCSPSRQMAPSFYTYPFNKVVEEGDNVTFKCAVKGQPTPWATWDKDGIIITPSARITLREKDELLRILEIEQVSIEDVGIYRITIENEFGRAEAAARLEVITQKGKFYGGVRAYSASPRKALTYRRYPSVPRQD